MGNVNNWGKYKGRHIITCHTYWVPITLKLGSRHVAAQQQVSLPKAGNATFMNFPPWMQIGTWLAWLDENINDILIICLKAKDCLSTLHVLYIFLCLSSTHDSLITWRSGVQFGGGEEWRGASTYFAVHQRIMTRTYWYQMLGNYKRWGHHKLCSVVYDRPEIWNVLMVWYIQLKLKTFESPIYLQLLPLL